MPLDFEPKNVTGVLLGDGAWRQVKNESFQVGTVNFAGGDPKGRSAGWWFRFAAEDDQTIAGPLDGVVAIHYDDRHGA